MMYVITIWYKRNSLHTFLCAQKYAQTLLACFVLVWILPRPNETASSLCVSRMFDVWSDLSSFFVVFGHCPLNPTMQRKEVRNHGTEMNKEDLAFVWECMKCLDLNSCVNISFVSHLLSGSKRGLMHYLSTDKSDPLMTLCICSAVTSCMCTWEETLDSLSLFLKLFLARFPSKHLY